MVNIMQVKYFDMHYVENVNMGEFAVLTSKKQGCD